MSRLEYVLNTPDRLQPEGAIESLAADLRRDLIPLGVWVVLRTPSEADAGLHGECSHELHERIDGIVRSIMAAHRDYTPRH